MNLRTIGAGIEQDLFHGCFPLRFVWLIWVFLIRHPCPGNLGRSSRKISKRLFPNSPSTVERMFELVTNCLVWMGFSFLRFRFGSSGVVIVVPVHVRKRKPRLKPATDLAFFSLTSGGTVKMSSSC